MSIFWTICLSSLCLVSSFVAFLVWSMGKSAKIADDMRLDALEREYGTNPRNHR